VEPYIVKSYETIELSRFMEFGFYRFDVTHQFETTNSSGINFEFDWSVKQNKTKVGQGVGTRGMIPILLDGHFFPCESKWLRIQNLTNSTNSTFPNSTFPNLANFSVEITINSSMALNGTDSITFGFSQIPQILESTVVKVEESMEYNPPEIRSGRYTLFGKLECEQAISTTFKVIHIATGDQCPNTWDTDSADHYVLELTDSDELDFSFDRSVLEEGKNRWWFYFSNLLSPKPSGCTLRIESVSRFPAAALYTLISVGIIICLAVAGVLSYRFLKKRRDGEGRRLVNPGR